VNDINLLDRWANSAQGHFTKNTDFFTINFSNSFNRCPKKTIVRDGHCYLKLNTLQNMNKFSNGGVVRTAEGKDLDLLSAVLQQMNLKIFWCLHQKILKWAGNCYKI
jgi:hypothetical protein